MITLRRASDRGHIRRHQPSEDLPPMTAADLGLWDRSGLDRAAPFSA